MNFTLINSDLTEFFSNQCIGIQKLLKSLEIQNSWWMKEMFPF
jgi:hypothetical protein